MYLLVCPLYYSGLFQMFCMFVISNLILLIPICNLWVPLQYLLRIPAKRIIFRRSSSSLICCSGVTFLCLVIYFYGKTLRYQWFVVSSNNQGNWIECLRWTVLLCLYQLENILPHIGFKILIIIFNWKYKFYSVELREKMTMNNHFNLHQCQSLLATILHSTSWLLNFQDFTFHFPPWCTLE